VPALNRPDPELEPENEDVRAPNIAVITFRCVTDALISESPHT
jgi:hypothetical protein